MAAGLRQFVDVLLAAFLSFSKFLRSFVSMIRRGMVCRQFEVPILKLSCRSWHLCTGLQIMSCHKVQDLQNTPSRPAQISKMRPWLRYPRSNFELKLECASWTVALTRARLPSQEPKVAALKPLQSFRRACHLRLLMCQ